MKSFLLFHWSPAERRKQILKYGLRPGCFSRCGQWKPPYVCFSKTPSLAWALSGIRDDKPGTWDLWQMWSNVPKGYETLSTDGSGKPTEYRVYHRIFKRDVWYIGSRVNK